MSNVKYIEVTPNTDYQNIATLGSISFTNGKTYTLQVEGDVMLCEAASKPEKGGFHINTNEPFQFEAGTDALWVKNLREFNSAYVNIAD